MELTETEKKIMNDRYGIDTGTFGDYLKEEWLELLGLSAYKLSRDLGISPTALSKILLGKNNMSNDVCRRLSRYFGMSPDFFINVQADYELRNTRDKFRRETENLPVYNWG